MRGRQLGIHGNKVVAASYLQAMPGIEEEGHARIVEGGSKLAQLELEACAIEINGR